MRKLLLAALVIVGLSVSWRSQPPAWDQVVPPAEAFYRASIIKSIQTGSVTINTGSTSGVATLTTAVSSTSSIILPGGTTTANTGGNANWGDATFVLTSTTGVTVTCPDDGAASPTCEGKFTVLEFYPNVLSATGVQRGTITLGAAETSSAATITSVVTSKSVVVPCGFRLSGGVRSAYTQTTQVLTSATGVTASRNAQDGSSIGTACWQVAEFKE